MLRPDIVLATGPPPGAWCQSLPELQLFLLRRYCRCFLSDKDGSISKHPVQDDGQLASERNPRLTHGDKLFGKLVLQPYRMVAVSAMAQRTYAPSIREKSCIISLEAKPTGDGSVALSVQVRG
jgi:hypothetical protein